MGRVKDEAIRLDEERLNDAVAYQEWSDGITRECEDEYYRPLAEREETRRMWGGTLALPTEKAGMRTLANGILASIKAWDSKKAEDEERIAAAWSVDTELDAHGHPPGP